jgi:alpha/beta superfamily hydrolase
MSTPAAVIPVEPGIALEARWDLPEAPRAVAVLSHPHPLYGGTMQVPLLRTVAARLVEANCAVLRFNFRGVGSSTGTWSGGSGEQDDLAAAIEAATAVFPGLPLRLAGWSFGAVITLCWQRDRGSRHRLAAIAPPTALEVAPPLPDPSSLAPAPRLFLVGSRDQFSDPAALESYAAALGAELQVIPGCDHFFYGREHRVGEAVAAHLAETAGA